MDFLPKEIKHEILKTLLSRAVSSHLHAIKEKMRLTPIYKVPFPPMTLIYKARLEGGAEAFSEKIYRYLEGDVVNRSRTVGKVKKAIISSPPSVVFIRLDQITSLPTRYTLGSVAWSALHFGEEMDSPYRFSEEEFKNNLFLYVNSGVTDYPCVAPNILYVNIAFAMMVQGYLNPEEVYSSLVDRCDRKILFSLYFVYEIQELHPLL